MNKEWKLNASLNRVSKPARYIGGEVNSTEKLFDQTKVRFAFSYPDVYEIGMSYNGTDLIYSMINSRDDYLCERVFAPWIDMEDELRKEDLSLFSLESKTPIKEFDFLGFTLQYEMSYTNILNILDLSGLALRSKNRSEEDPVVIGGGPCAYNPEPIADFFDMFLIGDGEESILEILDLYNKVKESGGSKDDYLKKVAKIDGVYVPKFYEEIYCDSYLIGRKKLYHEASDKIKKRYVKDFNNTFYTKKPIIPNIEAVHDRVVTEIFRGCTQGCRFCQAGILYRPIRERSVDNIIGQLDQLLEESGYDEISLSSLSTCDFPKLEELIKEILKKYDDSSVTVSLPSLRMDSKSLGVLKEIESGRKGSLTFAPEAGSQRLRDIINKNITDEDIDRAINFAFQEGYSTIKLYFMIGLPLENEKDLMGIKDIAYRIKDAFFKQDVDDMQGNLKINVSASCFVPKAFTPFQWEGQDDLEALYEKANLIRASILDSKINFSYHDPKLSMLEAVVARGDRRVSYLIEKAFLLGARFDAWQETFDYDLWLRAADETSIDLAFYANRKRDFAEVLPWDFIDVGVSKKFLKREWEKAYSQTLSPDCRDICHGCGVNKNYPGVYCP